MTTDTVFLKSNHEYSQQKRNRFLKLSRESSPPYMIESNQNGANMLIVFEETNFTKQRQYVFTSL